MKHKLLLLLLLCSTIAFSQIPSYYNDVNLAQSGTALKDDLATKIISTHSTYLSYTPGVWDALKQSDLDPNNSNNVLLIYGYNDTDGVAQTDRSRDKDANGTGIGTWNREHSYPKSLGTPNLGTSGPGSDAHHLRASDGQMNSTRNNRKYADGSGNAGITSEGHFYPGDEWKGDVARMMLYMYLRYDDRCLPINVAIGNAVSSDSNLVDLFLQWNVEDPVNGFEDQRNQVLEGIQGNRNPFIDNPAFATQIWGGQQAEDRFGSGTGGGTGTETGTANELFISEYVEGSSNNKVIEIANFTGSTISLSAYTLRKQVNGAGNWSTGLALSGSLNSGDVYVIANSSASTTAKANADVSTTNAALSFNGNDPVGLFKNGVLVDVVGTFNGGSANFAKDTTLRRQSTINSPNTTYTSTEWDTFNQDTFSGLGTHVLDGGSNPPNPPVTYCSTKGNSVADEYIDFVSIGGISNSSGANGGYIDNTSMVGNVNYGSNSIVFSTGFTGQSYTEYWKVWIDFNQDGTFDSSEEVVTGSSSSSSNLSATFNIPTSAQSGSTRMRVSMKYNAAPTPCETFSYGEVEDYTLNIGGSAKMANPAKPILADALLEETPVYYSSIYNSYNGLTLKMKDKRQVVYSMFTTNGSLVATGDFSEKISLEGLETGTYIIHINDGQRSIRKKIVKK
jgi:endonuclease I